jgi:hypothetical protein
MRAPPRPGHLLQGKSDSCIGHHSRPAALQHLTPQCWGGLRFLSEPEGGGHPTPDHGPCNLHPNRTAVHSPTPRTTQHALQVDPSLPLTEHAVHSAQPAHAAPIACHHKHSVELPRRFSCSSMQQHCWAPGIGPGAAYPMGTCPQTLSPKRRCKLHHQHAA